MSDTPDLTPERQALLQGLAAQAAAWWRAAVADPGYLSKFRNGDTSRDGEMAQIMASISALRSPAVPTDRLAAFEQQLTEALLKWLLLDPAPRRPAYEGAARYQVLSVDYGPEGMLRQVASAAGVGGGFPWKTTMWVCWDARPEHCYVEVRAGYGEPTQRLPAPDTLAATS